MLVRPENGGGGDAVEGFDVDHVDGHVVVVAENTRDVAFANNIGAFVGLGAVADKVAAADYCFILSFVDVRQGGRERREVAVEVGNKSEFREGRLSDGVAEELNAWR